MSRRPINHTKTLLCIENSPPFFLASIRKRLLPGAVPSLNLPVKSIPSSATTTRRELVRKELGKPVVYHNLESLIKRILKIKMKGWIKMKMSISVIFEFWNPRFSFPKITFSVTSGLKFSVAVYNCFLPNNHAVYTI